MSTGTGNGTVLVTSRSFATADPSPERDLATAGLTVARAGARHDQDELAQVLPDAVAWIAGTGPVTDSLLSVAPRLRVVARYGVGYDAVDVAAATRRGLWVTTTPGANADAVADLAVALMLDSLRHVTVGAMAVSQGDWSARRGRELGAMTVGVVGLGRIGQGVARRLLAFGSTVLAADPAITVSPVDGVDLVALDDLVACCDVVSLHAPGGRLLLDADRLSRMRPGATVVNTARADLVDESATAAALRDGRLAGYACDVLAAEHEHATSPLLAADLADRVLVTPHLGGQTDEAVSRMGRMAADDVLAVLRGEVPPHAINEPEVQA
jgi:D-3-phosphoglycerate dehydrogenase / 2-oxoglutarate reductase